MDIESKAYRLFEIYSNVTDASDETSERENVSIPTKISKYAPNLSYKLPKEVPLRKIIPPTQLDISGPLQNSEPLVEEKISEENIKAPVKCFGITLPEISDDSGDEQETGFCSNTQENDLNAPKNEPPPPPPLPVTPVPVLSAKPETPALPPVKHNSATNGRENLLDSIRKLGGFQGAKLKPTGSEPVQTGSMSEQPEVDLISQLSKQLADRRGFIQPQSSSRIRLPSQSSDSDSNWE